jgi:hypothetical protein
MFLVSCCSVILNDAQHRKDRFSGFVLFCHPERCAASEGSCFSFRVVLSSGTMPTFQGIRLRDSRFPFYKKYLLKINFIVRTNQSGGFEISFPSLLIISGYSVVIFMV